MPGSNRNPISQDNHDRKVAEIAKQRKKKGYEVKADLPNYPHPPVKGGFKPDLAVKKNGITTLIEVETLDSVNTTHAKAQDKAFKKARNNKTRYIKRITK